jgi:hypothetical protein
MFPVRVTPAVSTQVKTPLRYGVRPVRIADRDGEQTAQAE